MRLIEDFWPNEQKSKEQTEKIEPLFVAWLKK